MKKNESGSVVGNRLRGVREEFGLSQRQLGLAIGLEDAAATRISRYEAGIHEPPFEIVIKLAQVLVVPTAYFYCVDDQLAELLRLWDRLRDDERKRIITFLGDEIA